MKSLVDENKVSSLFASLEEVSQSTAAVVQVQVTDIVPNPYQPRREFDQDELESLAESIKENGLDTPIHVRSNSTGSLEPYELVAGERRWRAHKLLGLETIAAIVKDTTDVQSATSAIIENLQRVDLSLSDLLYGIDRLRAQIGNQVAVAQKLGKSKSWASKHFRLVDAQPFLKDFIAKGHSSDVLALYSLAQWADKDPDAAQTFLGEWVDSPEKFAGRALRDVVVAVTTGAAPQSSAPTETAAQAHGQSSGSAADDEDDASPAPSAGRSGDKATTAANRSPGLRLVPGAIAKSTDGVAESSLELGSTRIDDEGRLVLNGTFRQFELDSQQNIVLNADKKALQDLKALIERVLSEQK